MFSVADVGIGRVKSLRLPSTVDDYFLFLTVDGEYCLSVGESIAVIYCHDMQTSSPKEYITLR